MYILGDTKRLWSFFSLVSKLHVICLYIADRLDTCFNDYWSFITLQSVVVEDGRSPPKCMLITRYQNRRETVMLCASALGITALIFGYPGVLWTANVASCFSMMTSSSGNIFRVTGRLCGESTGHRWIPLTKASDAELWCFLWSAPE